MHRFINVLESITVIYLKTCTPPPHSGTYRIEPFFIFLLFIFSFFLFTHKA